MKATTGHKAKGKTGRFASNRKAKHILPALLAVSGACSLVAGTASALELGGIKIDSTLGQPLRASISYALNPTEQLFDFCIYLRPGIATTGVPTVSRPKITIEEGNIILTGNTPILEPLLAMQVYVDCPYTARLAREYTLMMSPPTAIVNVASQLEDVSAPAPTEPVQSVPVAAVAEQQIAKPTPALPSEPGITDPATSDPITNQTSSDPITMNSRYFVIPGDSLSTIARRIENRSVGVWPAVRAIFAANPEAFLDGDVNQLTAAVWLKIPDFSDSLPATDSNAVEDYSTGEYFDTQQEADASSAESYSGSDTSDSITEAEQAVADVAFVEPVAADVEETTLRPAAEMAAEPVTRTVEEPAAEAVSETSTDSVAAGFSAQDEAAVTTQPGQAADIVDDTAVLRPGDVVLDTVTGPAAESRAVPVVGSANIATTDSVGMPKWVLYAGAGSLALLVAFFAFRRTLKERFASRAAAAPAPAEELFDDKATAEPPIVDDVDFQFDDNTINSQSISLDADLGAGTGLQDSADLDVAQDFGFSASTTGEVEADIDLELPVESAAEPEVSPTDIIEPSHRIEEALIAVETPAAEDTQASATIDESAEYDLSMIVDATKQPLGEEELTAMDLMAVQVNASAENQDAGNQTLASEVDIAILEQDYQDEFTQTQALNDEIARAAEELALRMQEDDSAEVTSHLESVDDPAMTATVAASVAAGNDDLTDVGGATETGEQTEISDLEDTGVNLQLTANLQNPGNELTVEMPDPSSEKTVEMPNPGNEPTVEMANPGNDATVDMPVESGKVDTKKTQSS